MNYDSTDAQPYGLARTLAVFNGKGGVFKTSLTANVAGFAAAAGWDVVVVDLDPQGNQTEQLGLAHETDEGQSLVQAVMTGAPITPQPTGRDRLGIVYGGEVLKDLVAVLAARQGRDPSGWAHALARSLAPAAQSADMVLIDCQPDYTGPLPLSALTAARYAVVPTKSDAMSRKGLRRVAAQFVRAREFNPVLELLGVVRTGTGARSSLILEGLRRDLEHDLGGAAPVLAATVRHAESSAREACERGQLLHELDADLARQAPYWVRRKAGDNAPTIPPSTMGLAGDYAAVTQELLDLMHAAETREGTS